jgi:Flp pilus assembly protein TadD
MDPVKGVATSFIQYVNRHRWTMLGSCVFLLWIVPHRTVEGHGYMTEPRSRDAEYLKGDIKGWPIAGVPPYLTKPPCLTLPVNKQFTDVLTGPIRLKFFYGDGANHVGLCRVFLIDPKDPAHKTQIGEMMDCARSDHPGPGHKGEDLVGHMVVTIPSTLPCDPSHCVLQWSWIATHRSVTRPEIYDQCADIRIVGAQQAAVTAATAPAPEHEVEQTSAASRRELLGAGSIAFATGEDAVRRMLSASMANGGNGDVDAIMEAKRQIEALPLNRRLEPAARQQARAANDRGLQLLREGNMGEAVQAFKAAYELAPADIEIVNNFGFAYLQHNDPEAAEAWLLLAVVLAPERVNAWVNLGESYARQGEPRMAVASLANGYRFSKHQTATRQFLVKLADKEDEDAEVRKAAHQTLQLSLLQANK